MSLPVTAPPLVAPRAAWLALALAAASLLPACSFLSRDSLDNFSITYRINIQQGMVVTQEMAEQLKVGMTREQVKFVLGTPILTDPFHANRWDYPFRFQPGRGRTEERRFVVFFENDRMARVESDKLPTEEEFAASRNFATTRLAKGPGVSAGSTPAPNAESSGVGGPDVKGAPVRVPVRPSAAPPEETSAPPADTGGTTTK